MLLQPIANDLRLADISAGRVGLRVAANENIDSGLIEFLASEKLVQFGPGRGDSLAGPVGDFGSTQAFCISERKEEFDKSPTSYAP